MKQITTTVDRIRQAGYWCSDADRETSELLHTLGKNGNDEIPLRAILNILGLAVGLLSLGAVHPRYQLHANRIIIRYAEILFRCIGTALANIQQEAKLTQEFRAFTSPHRDSLRRDRRTHWRKEKLLSPDPKYRALCDALMILLSTHPQHIKLVHAGKAYLDAADSLALVHLTAHLGRMLDEPI